MANCIKCGSDLPTGALFCPSCGKRQRLEPRKYKKQANGTGTISKLSGNRAKPWMARRNDVCIGTFKTRTEAQKALERNLHAPCKMGIEKPPAIFTVGGFQYALISI